MRRDSIGFFWRDEPVVKTTKAAPIKKTPPKRTWERDDYLPYLEEARLFNVPLLTDKELADLAVSKFIGKKREVLIFDTEIYKNYSLIAFEHHGTGKVVYFEQDNEPCGRTWADQLAKLKWIINHFTIVGYNSNNFDCPILAMALAGCTTEQLKEFADRVIMLNDRPSDILRSFKVPALKYVTDLSHIDLIEVAPGVRLSLKIYGSRMGARRIQDLPFHPSLILNEDQICITRWYCVNDLDSTTLLYNNLQVELALREDMSAEHGLDLMSRSDAQIAEAIIGKEVGRLNGRRCQSPTIAPGTVYKYFAPAFLQFTSPEMQWVLDRVVNTNFVVGEDGKIEKPESLDDLKIPLGASVYTMGIGGLHSNEKNRYVLSDDEYDLYDVDAESFYPKIITTLGLYPLHMGPAFLKVFDEIITRRLDAKHKGWKKISDSLKIVINGTYGKLGSKWSILYAPDLLIQTTLTGQLALLMLVERLEQACIPVVSGNTDGIVVKCPKRLRTVMQEIIAKWEVDVSFKTEESKYAAVYSSNINNYIAIKPDGKLKTKGWFAEQGLRKSPATQICVDAICQYLATGKPLAATIRESNDITKFVRVQQVKGGAVKVYEKQEAPPHTQKEELVTMVGFREWPDPGKWTRSYEDSVHTLDEAYAVAKSSLEVPTVTEYLGKTVRWYYPVGEQGDIIYAKTGNRVSRTENAKPLMTLPDQFPTDISYEWYINNAQTLLNDLLGVE